MGWVESVIINWCEFLFSVLTVFHTFSLPNFPLLHFPLPHFQRPPKKTCNRWMTLTYVTVQGHHRCCYKMAIRHITLCLCGLLFQHFYLGPFSRHCYFWSKYDCLWPWELPHFWQRNLNYKPRALSDLCVNISQLNHALFMTYRYYKGFIQQKWPQTHSRSLASLPFDSPYMISICLPL